MSADKLADAISGDELGSVPAAVQVRPTHAADRVRERFVVIDREDAPAGEELVSALTRDLRSDPWLLRNPDEAESAARYFVATGWTKSEVSR